MPQLSDIHISAINGDDFQAQLQSIVKQLNDWGRAISNESITNVYHDNSGINRIIIGVLPDNDTAIVMSKEGVDILSAFS